MTPTTFIAWNDRCVDGAAIFLDADQLFMQRDRPVHAGQLATERQTGEWFIAVVR